MKKEEIIKLIEEFIETLNDTIRDEYYTTEAELGQRFLDKFQEWLDKKESKNEHLFKPN